MGKITALRKGFVVHGGVLIILLVGIVFLAGYILGRNAQQGSQAPLYLEQEQPFSASVSGNIFAHGPRDKKQIALTFDAEMTAGMKADVLSGKTKSAYDKSILDTLHQTKTPATIFLTGMWIELYPGETKVLANDPLIELGSHSYTDSSYEGYCFGLRKVPDDQVIEEIGSTEKLLRKYAGVDNKFFRFPGGCYSQHDVDLVNQAGDTVVHWDVIGGDGFNKNTNSIVNSVLSKTQNGSIIILHLNGGNVAPKTSEALPQIISTLKSRGFEFVKVSTLLGLPPETRSTVQ